MKLILRPEAQDVKFHLHNVIHKFHLSKIYLFLHMSVEQMIKQGHPTSPDVYGHSRGQIAEAARRYTADIHMNVFSLIESAVCGPPGCFVTRIVL